MDQPARQPGRYITWREAAAFIVLFVVTATTAVYIYIAKVEHFFLSSLDTTRTNMYKVLSTDDEKNTAALLSIAGRITALEARVNLVSEARINFMFEQLKQRQEQLMAPPSKENKP